MSSIAAIHVAKSQLGLDDDTYRSKLASITGKTSTRDMSEAERQKVLTVLRGQGFGPRPAQRKDRATGKYAPKLQSLWIAAWNLGIVRDKRDAAMLAFVKRQTGLDHTRFLSDAGDAARAIEALKGWIRRETGNDWMFRVRQDCRPALNDPRTHVVMAQWAIVRERGQATGLLGELLVRMGFPVDFGELSGDQWIAVMNDLGTLIRGAS
ncbi:regulatory protein GemA [Pannonibacter sp. SL95]|uniref:regulatory protein GemA n=1 Tax=Pannonibacter sp. SL95 TaxID=2995153 RepID=UPI0022729137|nr:regulatory protein GemA [Pannonibacter sp. SL95]MCY1705505.1 regulatory protein GemA [Pannonibacter sp. SL95]